MVALFYILGVEWDSTPNQPNTHPANQPIHNPTTPTRPPHLSRPHGSVARNGRGCVQRAQDGKGVGGTQVGPWARLRRGTGWRGCGGAQVGGGRAGARGAARPT